MKSRPLSSGNQTKIDEVLPEAVACSRQRSQPMQIVSTPTIAAGVPPSSTAASMIPRKLPEMFMIPDGSDVAVRSLLTESTTSTRTEISAGRAFPMRHCQRQSDNERARREQAH